MGARKTNENFCTTTVAMVTCTAARTYNKDKIVDKNITNKDSDVLLTVSRLLLGKKEEGCVFVFCDQDMLWDLNQV